MADRTLQANFSANTAGFTQGTNALRQRLLELNTSMEQTRQAVRNANQQVREYQKELRQLQQSTQNGNTATAEQRSRMQELRDRIAQTTSQLGTLRTAEQDLRGQIRNANAELNNQQTALQSVTSGASTMGQVLKANLYSAAIQSAVSKLTSALKSAAQYCYDVGTSFESSMSQVAAVSGAAADDLDMLSDKAKALGASTKFTATEVAQAMNYMGMAGWDAMEMYEGIDGVISLAAASGGDLATTADIVTDAITAFGLEAGDVAQFSDVLAAASANANTNVAMMGETFQYCAPIAGALGFSIEDVSEAIGLMANSGIKSSMAGTALRTLFTKLSDEITITGQNLGEVTIQTSNADGSMRSLNDILTDMRSAFAQLTESERSSAAESIAGKYAMTGLLSLMNAGEEDVNKLRTAIEECDGAAANMAETMQNNTAGAVTIMKSALDGLANAVYEKFGDELRDKINGLTDVFSDLTNRIDAGEFDEVFERVANSVGNAADQLVDFAKTGLPAAIEGLANLISFLVEFRGVIAGVVTTMVTFKAAMALNKTITGLQLAIKSISTAMRTATSATEAMTAAQAANNAVAAANPYLTVASAILALVGGISALIGVTVSASNSMSDAAQSAEELRQKADELNQTAQEAKDAADDVHELVEEYQNIKETSDDTEEAKKRLKEIQDILIDSYDVEAEKIDLVNGKYEDQILLLDQLIDKKSDDALIQARSAISSIELAQSKPGELKIDTTATEFEGGDWKAVDNLWDYLLEYYGNGISANGKDNEDHPLKPLIPLLGGDWLSFTAGTTYEQRTNILSSVIKKLQQDVDKFEAAGDTANADLARQLIVQLTSLYNENNKMYENLQSAQGIVDYYEKGSNNKNDGDGYYAPGGWMAAQYSDYADRDKKTKTEETGVDWSDYNSVKNYYKYLYDVEKITGEQYYDYLERFANNLLDPNSDEWRSATSEIYKGRKSLKNSSGSGSGSVSKKDPNEEAYNSDKEYLKWRLDMGYITEEEYYSQLKQLRDKYLDEDSKAWRDATREIHNYQVKKDKEAGEANEEAYNKERKYLKWRLDMGYITEEEYYNQIAILRDKYLDDSSDAWRDATLEIHDYQVKKDEERNAKLKKEDEKRFDNFTALYDSTLSAIDEMDKQHKRDKEDEDYDKQLAEIDKQLKYGRLDDYSRQQLEQKKQEVLDEREETLRQRGIEDLKSNLGKVYTMAKDAYEEGTADLTDALSVASGVFTAVGTGASLLAGTVSTVTNNNNVNMTLGGVSLTAAQIAAAVIKALTSGI